MRKILFNNPWLLPVIAFLGFVALWVAFIFFAVKNKPAEVKRTSIRLPQSWASAATRLTA